VIGVDQDVETRLRAALRDALKSRDMVAAFAVRSALGAIGNAGAVPAGEDGAAAATPTPTGSAYVAKAAAGAGATEAVRRQLSPADIRAIVEAEISERETTAGQYQQADRAGRLRREAQILRDVLAG
jgi:uncharacterized protein YqeY